MLSMYGQSLSVIRTLIPGVPDTGGRVTSAPLLQPASASATSKQASAKMERREIVDVDYLSFLWLYSDLRIFTPWVASKL